MSCIVNKLVRNRSGDTIVEVLLSLVVLTTVITIAYSIASRSTQQIRAAQERTEAVKIAETQLERLKYLADLSAPATNQNVFAVTVPFCLNEVPVIETNIGNCNSDNLYSFNVVKSDNTFTATVNWDKLGGGPQEVAAISLRVYEP